MPRGFLLFFALFAMARAASLEDAVRIVSKGLAARLAAGEAVKITARNLTSLPAAELEKARALTQRALRRTPSRNKPPLDLFLSLSENPQGFLLIGELRRGTSQRFVEMASFDAAPQASGVRPILSRRLLLEQSVPLLDVLPIDNRLLVLDTRGVFLHELRNGKWEPVASKLLAAAPSRDPRGLLELHAAGQFQATVNDASCQGTFEPALDFTCSPNLQPLPLSQAIISPNLTLRAANDGRIHLLDALQNTVSTHEGWGSAIASPGSSCGSDALVFHTGPGDWRSPDTLSLYDWSTRKPVETGNRLEFSAPIVELRPRAGAVLAITASHEQESYSAYLVTVDCSR